MMNYNNDMFPYSFRKEIQIEKIKWVFQNKMFKAKLR